MELAPDITPDDLKVFLEEADEQLQLLDESILQLERDGENPELIQGIFRAAHTLKGSSAMLGYEPMSELGHAMETLFDKVRKGTASANTQVVDALLHSLDQLRLLKEALETEDHAEIDSRSVVEELERAGASQEGEGGQAAAAKEGQGLTFSEESIQNLKTQVAEGRSAFKATVSIMQGSEWVAVRCFQILNELNGLSEVIASSPDQQTIEAGADIPPRMEVVFETRSS